MMFMKASANSTAANPGLNRQFVLFGQERSLFAVEITSVCEVLFLSQQPITPIPNTMPFLLGLSNLRGEILAVVDFGRLSGGIPVDRNATKSRILVVEALHPQDVTLPLIRLGLAVSSVEGVLSLNPDQIGSAAEVSAEIAPFLRGLYHDQERLLMIIDIEAITHIRERW